MNAKKPKRGRSKFIGMVQQLVSPLMGHGTRPVMVVAVVMVLASGWYFGWKKWGPSIVRGTRYKLSADSLVVTPAPPWIHTDIRAEVMRDGSLADLSILDPDVTKQVAHAFELHTWVARVIRVVKRAGSQKPRILVDLQYREPSIMVKTKDGFWPVDTAGVLLQPNDLSPSQTLEYLRLWSGDRQPVGPVGTPFGDPIVEGAARLAVALRGVWKPLGLQWITAQSAASHGVPADNPVYVLLPPNPPTPEQTPRTESPTSGNRVVSTQSVEVIWGHAPGHEAVNESRPVEKVARLTQFVRQYGPLDQQKQSIEIDLQPRPGITINVHKSPTNAASFGRPMDFGPASGR